MPIELHCHSLFSPDGWVTPEALAEAKAAAGITVLSLTDHDTLDGLERCEARAGELGMRFINGVEFDALWQRTEYHFIALGFDRNNPRLCTLTERQFDQHRHNFDRIMPVLERRYGVKREDLVAGLPGRYPTHPSPFLNKWFARSFLKTQGVFKDADSRPDEMTQVVAEAERDVARPWDWAKVQEVRDTVHQAGGILLLAHPPGELDAKLELIEAMLAIGLDGFELYHPANIMRPFFNELVAGARRLGCAVSGGSDSHRLDHEALAARHGFSVPDWVMETIDNALEKRRG